jgi:uncharacterized protein with PIN domain
VGTVLDAQALVALALDEPAASEVELLLRRGDVAMAAPNLAECLDVLKRVEGYDDDLVRSVVEPLAIVVMPMTEWHAWRAAALRKRHYERETAAVSLADCTLVASAKAGDAIASADRAVLRMAEAEGIATIPLPDSTGART